MNKRKLLSAVLASLLMATSFSIAWADEDLEGQLEDLQQKAQQQQQVTDEAAARVDNISEKLRELQEQVSEATRAYKAVKAELDETQAKIDDNEEVLEKTEAELKKKGKILNKRIKDIYINGQISYIDVLFGAKDFSDFMTRMDILKRIIKHDYDLVNEVREKRNTVIATKEALEKDKASIVSLVNDAKLKEKDLEDAKDAQDQLLQKAQYDKVASEQAYNELIAASEQITKMIRQRELAASSSSGGGGFYTGSAGAGGMVWPLDGPVTSEFGWRTHPIFGTQRYHSGLDIGGDYGLPIRAAASGTVIYAGWISGYGNAVIIDHGGGLTTLYGHNEELTVSEGQSVGQGQQIAWCGSTGNSTGPHCHFEVRMDGEPVSPYGYL